MHFVWILLLLPAQPGDPTTAFPTTFSSREACVSLATVLITKWEFRCVVEGRPMKLAGLEGLTG